MPFPDGRFDMVVFDPPHIPEAGALSWLAKKYGTLSKNWREDLRQGFAECFRVLKPHGTLIFKWNECKIARGKVLDLCEYQPVFGTRTAEHSHFFVFMKEV
jgi:23S rRNA G2069 N7-methylase RlmK/C1962 C5-methylase RlmI